MADEKLYQEELMSHFRYPQNRKQIEKPDFSSGIKNPSCGDSVSIEGKLERDQNDQLLIKDLGFSGSGCVISQAATSMLTEKCIGKTVEQVLTISKEDILKMIGLQLGPTRLRCALLCLEALQAGLAKFKRDYRD